MYSIFIPYAVLFISQKLVIISHKNFTIYLFINLLLLLKAFYWRCMSPSGGGKPTGALIKAIDSSFGSYEAFKEQFMAAGSSLFGSGWVWLVLNKESNKLEILKTTNADTPLVLKKKDSNLPLLTMDVWEHAYYLGTLIVPTFFLMPLFSFITNVLHRLSEYAE